MHEMRRRRRRKGTIESRCFQPISSHRSQSVSMPIRATVNRPTNFVLVGVGVEKNTLRGELKLCGTYRTAKARDIPVPRR